MSEYMFSLYHGHLSASLIKRVETKFPHVAVVNYTGPRGEKRGWFAGPNRGSPFNAAMASEVTDYAWSIAKGKDAECLGAGRK